MLFKYKYDLDTRLQTKNMQANWDKTLFTSHLPNKEKNFNVKFNNIVFPSRNIASTE